LRGFVIRNRRVSRPHAILERRLDSVWLTDTNSKNGTFVNGERLAGGVRRLLVEGDLIQFWKGMKGLTLFGAKPPTMAAAQLVDSNPCATQIASKTQDDFGFEPGAVEFAKLGARPEAASSLAKRFQPIQVISTGGMGRVILAQDVLSGRFVAVKIMLRDILESEQYVQQFIREAVITARLQHPHIIPIYDLGFFTDGQLFYSMRYIEGKQFDELRSAIDLPERLRILRATALAVDYAHSLGLWHRDLKPQNILVGDFGDTYVIDWGLVSVQNGRDYRLKVPKIVLGRKTIVLPDNLIKETEKALSATHGFMGPPAYMAPEQLAQDAARMGAVSDVWALGIMCFEALTGQHPLENFKGAPNQLMPSVLAEAMPSARDIAPDAPARLSALCERMLVKDPSRRMSDLSEFIVEVEAFLRTCESGSGRDVFPQKTPDAAAATVHAQVRVPGITVPVRNPTLRSTAEPTICPKDPTSTPAKPAPHIHRSSDSNPSGEKVGS
jgi:serine/threonine-protein kinase